MNLREAAQQALEALEVADSWGTWHRGSEAITALRAALAEGAMQRLTDVHQEIEKTHTSVDTEYTPVKPLTDEQLESIEHKAYLATFSKGKPMGDYATELMRAIERAHGIGG